MAKLGKIALTLAVAGIGLPAMAQTPVWGPAQLEPVVGLSLTHYLGGQQFSSSNELGFSFSVRDERAAAYDLNYRQRPALVDMRFNSQGMDALNINGVNALTPKYRLAAEEGGGFMSHINWGIVIMAATAGGVYLLADKQNDDRDQDARDAANAPTRTAP